MTVQTNLGQIWASFCMRFKTCQVRVDLTLNFRSLIWPELEIVRPEFNLNIHFRVQRVTYLNPKFSDGVRSGSGNTIFFMAKFLDRFAPLTSVNFSTEFLKFFSCWYAPHSHNLLFKNGGRFPFLLCRHSLFPNS